MSGGVDSSVAACLMKQQGYTCMGVTMKLYDNEEIGVSSEKTCCTLKDVEDARFVAQALDMPYYVLNFKDKFEEEVIQRFVDTYIEGGTPNPCIDCNHRIKFRALMRRMEELGYDYVVTGHYARISYDETSGKYILKKALDSTKDQSYVLYNLTQEQLAHTLFPLGTYERRKREKSPRPTAFSMPTSMTARISASCLTAITENSLKATVSVPEKKKRVGNSVPLSREILSPRTEKCWAITKASSITRSASGRAWGFLFPSRSMYAARIWTKTRWSWLPTTGCFRILWRQAS